MMFKQIFFFDFLYNRLCCGYSFELHEQVDVDAIQMGTHNIFLYKEVDKSTLAVTWRLPIAWLKAYRGMWGN